MIKGGMVYDHPIGTMDEMLDGIEKYFPFFKSSTVSIGHTMALIERRMVVA
jgi:hypothetical protein